MDSSKGTVTSAANWPLFVFRAGVALMLGLAIVASTNLYLSGFAGMLGLYTVTDGVVAGISWLRDRRFKELAIEGALAIVLGFAMMVWVSSANELLIVVALSALSLAAVQASYVRATLSKHDARFPLIGAATCGAVGLGFLIISAFGYDALQLYACIAGYHALLAATLLGYGLKLRNWQHDHGSDRRSFIASYRVSTAGRGV